MILDTLIRIVSGIRSVADLQIDLLLSAWITDKVVNWGGSSEL